MTWISALFEYIAKLWPFVKVTAWERAIRVTHLPWDFALHRRRPWVTIVPPRTIVEELGPGVHFAIWWLDEVHQDSIVAMNYELPIQSVTTKDDRSVTFGVNITLEIVDMKRHMTEVHNFQESMYGVVRMHLARRTRAMTWAELIAGQDDLERSLKGTLTTRLKDWGARVLDVGFSDLTHTRGYRFYGHPPTTSGSDQKTPPA